MQDYIRDINVCLKADGLYDKLQVNINVKISLNVLHDIK